MTALVVGVARDGGPALEGLLAGLARSFPAVVLVVAHRGGPHDDDDDLVARLRPRCALPVVLARDKAPLVPGRVLVAPAAYHLLVDDGRCALSAGAPESGERPAIAALFDTAAADLALGLVAVLLGDTGADGAAAAEALPPGALVRPAPDDDLVARVLSRLSEVAR